MSFYTTISYRNYYKFEARIYAVPGSFNRFGTDTFPKYFLRPTKLLEVMAYSKSPRSTDDGFEKDKTSGLYLKNRTEINDTVEYSEIDAQFEVIRLSSPYWFHDESSYFEFAQANMDSKYSSGLEMLYTQNPSKAVAVGENEDMDIKPEHFYKETTNWTTKRFNKQVVKTWPIEKGVIITRVTTGI